MITMKPTGGRAEPTAAIDPHTQTWRAVTAWVEAEKHTHMTALAVEGQSERIRDGAAGKLALLKELEALAHPKVFDSSDPLEGTSDAVG